MTLAELCVKRGVFAVMLITFLVVLGIFSFRELGVDLFPRADPATVNINVRLPGATPEEMTTQVLLPLEEALSTISGLDEMTSTATVGSARITCQFVLEREIESAAQDVREKVAGALRDLPPTILPPIIQKADPDADPVLTLVVAGDKSLRETTEIADKRIKRVLETVDGVGEVSLTGARLRQIRVFADADKLAAYGLTIIDVEHAIQTENVEIPGGTIVHGDAELGIRTLGRLDAVSQFGDIIVKNVGGSPIRVSDLGRVEDSFAEPRSWNMLGGKPAVSLDVRRQSGTNTVKIIDTVKREIARIQKTLPPGLTLRIIRDQSVFINASIASLEEHLLFGSLLASLVVFLFIRSPRSVLIASLAIPTSIISTFTILKAMDFTLNNMTLLALTLAVGIVIDDAIVVLENIVRYLEEKHFEPRAAAIEATKEITLAVLATTLSLVIIFLPIAFMSGYARRYVNQFGWTMAFSILVSMLVSFTLTPMLSSRLLRAVPAGGSHHATKEWPFFAWIDRQYGMVLRWALDHRRAVMAACFGTFLLALPLNALVGRDWIPPDDQGELTVLLNLPEGTSLDATSRITTEIAAKVEALKGVEFVNPYVHEGLDEPFPHLRQARGPQAAQLLEPGCGRGGAEDLRLRAEPAQPGRDPLRAGGRGDVLSHPRPHPRPRLRPRGGALPGRGGPHPQGPGTPGRGHEREPQQPRDAGAHRPPARLGSGGAGGRRGQRGPPHDRGRGPDLDLQGGRRAVRRDPPTPARAAEEPGGPVEAQHPVLEGGPGAARQPGHHPARRWARRASTATTGSSRWGSTATTHPTSRWTPRPAR